MKVEIKGNLCIVTRETTDRKFRNGGWGDGESQLLYHVKNILNNRGFNFIKKRMGKDGHLVDDRQQYLRPAKFTSDPAKNIAIWNPGWAIEGAERDFNEQGQAVLRIETEFLGKGLPCKAMK